VRALNEKIDAWISEHHRWLLVGLLLAVYGTTLLLTQGLNHPIRADEEHFWETTRDFFVQPFPPSIESLRSYRELITPLSYILWGQLERLTGEAILAGRVVNLLMSVAVMLLLAARGARPVASLGSALGILAYPYFIALGFHLYTDMIAGFFVVFGLHFHLRGRRWAGFVLFALAIATRQYLVQIPAAIVAWEGLCWLRDRDPARFRAAIAPGLACATLLGWIAFWGGLAPKPGLDHWVPLYPAPMMSVSSFILHYGLYYLVILGFYFAAVEALVFRELPRRETLFQPWVAVVAVALALLFWLSPPFLSGGHPGGPFGRIMRAALPGPAGDMLRITIYYVLALFGAVRLGIAGGLALLISVLGSIMSMKSQIPWEKYLFPCLLSLWYLRSRPDLAGGIPSVRALRSDSDDTRSP